MAESTFNKLGTTSRNDEESMAGGAYVCVDLET